MPTKTINQYADQTPPLDNADEILIWRAAAPVGDRTRKMNNANLVISLEAQIDFDTTPGQVIFNDAGVLGGNDILSLDTGTFILTAPNIEPDTAGTRNLGADLNRFNTIYTLAGNITNNLDVGGEVRAVGNVFAGYNLADPNPVGFYIGSTLVGLTTQAASANRMRVVLNGSETILMRNASGLARIEGAGSTTPLLVGHGNGSRNIYFGETIAGYAGSNSYNTNNGVSTHAFDSWLSLREVVDPAVDTLTYGRFYNWTDGRPYWRTDQGVKLHLSGIDTEAADMTGALDDDLIYRSSSTWVPTAGGLTWNGSTLTLAATKTINLNGIVTFSQASNAGTINVANGNTGQLNLLAQRGILIQTANGLGAGIQLNTQNVIELQRAGANLKQFNQFSQFNTPAQWIDEEEQARKASSWVVDISQQATGHLSDPTFTGYYMNVIDAGRTSTGAADFIRLANDGADIFALDATTGRPRYSWIPNTPNNLTLGNASRPWLYLNLASGGYIIWAGGASIRRETTAGGIANAMHYTSGNSHVFEDYFSMAAVTAPTTDTAGWSRFYHDIADSLPKWRSSAGVVYNLAGLSTEAVDLTGAADDDLLYRSSSTWVPTGTNFRFDGTNTTVRGNLLLGATTDLLNETNSTGVSLGNARLNLIGASGGAFDLVVNTANTRLAMEATVTGAAGAAFNFNNSSNFTSAANDQKLYNFSTTIAKTGSTSFDVGQINLTIDAGHTSTGEVNLASYYVDAARVYQLTATGQEFINGTAANTPGIAGLQNTTTGLRWDTTATGAITVVTDGADRYVLGSTRIRPAVDGGAHLGSTSFRFIDLYLSGDVKDNAGALLYWPVVNNFSVGGQIITVTNPNNTLWNSSSSLTNTTATPLNIGHSSSGAVVAGFGTGMQVLADTATINDRLIGRYDWTWTDATDATRTSQWILSVISGGSTVGVLTADTTAGAQYAADYSGGYTDRSLIDRGYANATYALDSNLVKNNQANTYTGGGAQTFENSTIRITNGVNYYQLGLGAITGNRQINFPVVAATDNLVTDQSTSTLLNKTINANSNTITNINDDEIAAHTSTKITITDKGQLNTSIVYTDQANDFGLADQSFKSSRFKIWNPAITFRYTFVASAIAADRNITIPLLTANDVLVTQSFAQTLSAKTLTSPVINTQISGTVTSGGNITATNYLVGATATQTLSAKTLTSPVINTQISGTVTSGGNITATNYLVGATASQTLTNKTIAAGSNTITGIGSGNVVADLITGQTIAAALDGANDQLLLYDSSATALRKEDINAIVAAGQGGITITESQITDGTILARVGSAETITNTWTFNSAPSVGTVGITENGTTFKRRIVNIGAWDMDTDATKTVTISSFDFSKIRRITAMIENDDSGPSEKRLHPIERDDGWIANVNNNAGACDVLLNRVNAGFFDHADFDSTTAPSNRGYLVIDYVP